MNRVDWLVLRRILTRFAITFIVFFGLFALVETLNTQKIQRLSALGGPGLALLGVVLTGLRSSIGALPVTALIGTVAGVIDLQARRELTVMLSSGISIWRLIFAPVAAVFLLACGISIFGETSIITLNRTVLGQPANRQGPSWLEQVGTDGAYILRAERVSGSPPAIYNVEVFLASSPDRDRIIAPSAVLKPGHWEFGVATHYRPDSAPEILNAYTLPTATTLGDLRLKASGTVDLTLPELVAAAAIDVSQSDVRSVTLTSLYRTFTLPLMVVGSMLIGVAAAAGYRRNVKYADTVLFAIIVGFVLFVVNEMAVRAGNAGVLAPALATAGPALVSILVGVTALLYSQDGTI